MTVCWKGPATCIATLAISAATVPSGSLRVTVTDDHGHPLPGATVTISHASAESRFQRANKDGESEFHGLPPGRGYTVQVEFPGFAPTQIARVRVRSGLSSTLPLRLVGPAVSVESEGFAIGLFDAGPNRVGGGAACLDATDTLTLGHKTGSWCIRYLVNVEIALPEDVGDEEIVPDQSSIAILDVDGSSRVKYEKDDGPHRRGTKIVNGRLMFADSPGADIEGRSPPAGHVFTYRAVFRTSLLWRNDGRPVGPIMWWAVTLRWGPVAMTHAEIRPSTAGEFRVFEYLAAAAGLDVD